MKKHTLLLLAFLASFNTNAADYFWVGGTGNWSEIFHWATSSGGSGRHTSVPGPNDNVYFDANSFTTSGQTITLNIIAYCKDFDWSAATNAPTLAGTNALFIYGSFITNNTMTWNATGNVNLDGVGTHDFDMDGLAFSRPLYFNDIGTYNLLDSIRTSGIIQVSAGTINTNNHKITCNRLEANTTTDSIFLYLGTSLIETVNTSTISYGVNLFGTKILLDADSSTFLFRGSTNNRMRCRTPQHFHKIEMYTGNSTIDLWAGTLVDSILTINTDNITNISKSNRIGYLYSDGDVNFNENDTIAKAELSSNINIRSNKNVVCDTLIMRSDTGGSDYVLNSNSLLKVNDSLLFEDGTCEFPNKLRGASTFAKGILNVPSGNVSISYFELASIDATGGATFTSNNTISDDGNNSGWTINLLAGQNFYWVGGSGDWHDVTHWALSSGGTPLSSGDCIPRSRDNVYFDANSFSSSSQVVSITEDASCFNMDWSGVTNIPALANSTATLNIYGNLVASSNVNWNFDRDLHFRGIGNHTVDFDGLVVDHNIYFSDTGIYALVDSINTSKIIYINNGTFQSQNHKITSGQFYQVGNPIDTVNIQLGTSTLFTNAVQNSTQSTVALTSNKVVMDASNTSWHLNGAGNYARILINSEVQLGRVFITPGLTSFSLRDGSTVDSLTIYNATFQHSISRDVSYNFIACNGPLRINNDPTIKKLEGASDLTIGVNSSTTIDTLVLTNGGGDRTYTIYNSADLTITDSISFPQGDCSGDITLTSSSLTQTAELIKTSGTVNIDYVNLISVEASGGATFNASNVLYDDGNNPGWNIDSFQSIDLFWVGGTGNYDDPTQWSLSSGGTPQGINGCAPNNQSNVIFDVNSFSALGQSVTIGADEECVDMIWDGVLYSPTFSGTDDLAVYGDFLLDSSINWTFSGDLLLRAGDSANCDLAGVEIKGKTAFDASGSYHLQDSFHSHLTIEIIQGGLYSNDHKIHCKIFTAVGSQAGHLGLGTSTLELDSSSNYNARFMLQVYNSNMLFDLDQTTIHFIDSTNDYAAIRALDAAAFGTIEFNPACFNSIFGENTTIDTLIYNNRSTANHIRDFVSIDYVVCQGVLILEEGCDVRKGQFFNDFTSEASAFDYTFDTLVLNGNNGARTYTLAVGERLVILDSISFPQGDCETIHTLTSSNPLDTASLVMASGNVLLDYAELYSISASGGATFMAQRTIAEDGNNQGWNLTYESETDLYWIGGSGDFNDPTQWSLSSGGTPQSSAGCIPTPVTNVIFDANSFSATGQTITLNSTGKCASMDWSAASNNPTFTGTSDLLVYGDFTLKQNMTYNQNGDRFFLCPDTCNIAMDGIAFTSGETHFDGRGSYYLVDSFGSDDEVFLNRGLFNSKGHDITVSHLNVSGSDTTAIDFSTSVLTLNGFSNSSSKNLLRITGPSLSVLADSCVIILDASGNSAPILIAGTPVSIHKIINKTTLFYLTGNGTTIDSLSSTGSGLCQFRSADTIAYMDIANDVSVLDALQTSTASIAGDLTINGGPDMGYCVVEGILTTNSDVSFQSLILRIDGPGVEHEFSDNDTCSISDSLFIKSNGCFNTKISSSSSTNQAYIKMPAGKSFTSNFLNLTGLNAFGGALFNAGSSSSDLGNNTGWTFTGPIPTLQLKFTNVCIDTMGQSNVQLVPDGTPDMFWWQETVAPFDTFNTNIDTIQASTPATYIFISQYGNSCVVQDSVNVFYTSPASGVAQSFSNIVGDESWFNCTNWSQNYIPDSISDASISTGDTARINAGEDAFCKNLENNGVLEITGGRLHVYGDFNNTGSFIQTGGVFIFRGSSSDSIESNTTLYVDSIEIDKPASLHLSAPLTVAGYFTLTQGKVLTTAADSLVFASGAASNSGSVNSFIDGPLYKVGSDAFEFPTGDSARWARIAISAPSSGGSNIFKAEYFKAPYVDVSNIISPLTAVSALEYWQLDRIAGSGAVKVTLHYNDSSASGISDLATLRVAKYDGSNWNDMDSTNSNSTGASGYVVSDYISTFSPFTFGTTNSINYLPVDFLDVDASWKKDDAVVIWQTASEDNNSHFDLERSFDGVYFETVGSVASKNSQSRSVLSYDYIDHGVKFRTRDVVYYRIKQVDFDGHYAYSTIVRLNNTAKKLFSVHPNPSKGEFVVKSQNSDFSMLVISDPFGREVARFTMTSEAQHVDLRHLRKGVYYLSIDSGRGKQTRMVIIE